MQVNPHEISIITFNTLGTPFLRGHQKRNYLKLTYFLLRRFKKLSQVLNDSGADVIALQEVHLYPLLSLLKRRLTNFPYVFYQPFIYGPRGGMVTFSKYPLVDCQYVDFLKHGSFRNWSFIYKITQNGIMIVRLAESSTYIINTTVSADTDHNWSPDSQFNSLKTLQMNQLAATINTLSDMQRSVIAVGDFNMVQDSPQYKHFCAITGAKNIFVNYEIPTQHADFLPKDITKIPRLDYIFVKPNHTFSTLETKHLFREKVLLGKRSLYLSDHLGLFASVTFHKERKDTIHHLTQPSIMKTVN
ncbi:hypothetical protein BH11PAT1_BH11PAT1_6040 [soil metagenome]